MLVSYAVEDLSRPLDLRWFFLQVAAILPVAFGRICLMGLEPEDRSAYRHTLFHAMERRGHLGRLGSGWSVVPGATAFRTLA